MSATPCNIDLTPFYLGPPKNSKSVRPPSIISNPPKILENLTLWIWHCYKMGTFKNCKEVKHIMMIIAIIYIFLILWDIWLTVENWTSRTCSGPFEKIYSPLFTHSLPRSSKSESPPLFVKIENFLGPPCSKRGDTNEQY